MQSSSSFPFRRPNAAGRRVCFALSLLFVLVLFGDVLFLRTSLAPLDYDEGILASSKPLPQPRSIIPERHGRSTMDGQGDLWSGSAQFEPALKFMAFCVRSGESPYWDPYTAAGALGPEVLVDMKFSPVTLITALLGGSSAALTFVLVALFLLSAYCLLRTFTGYMGRSFEAAIAGTAIFFLNGFALANLNLAIGQPYYLAPIVLYAMLNLMDRGSAWTVALAIGAMVALFSTTFTPTVVLSLLVIYSVTVGLGLAHSSERPLKLLALHIAIPSAALLLLSFLYIPVFDALGTYLRTLADYNARHTPGISLINTLSLFTPKHFWESYAAMRMPATAPPGPYNRYTFHLGIIGPIIAVHCLSRLNRRIAPVIIGAAALFSVAIGQVLGLLPFTLVDSLPFFSFVQNDYWPCMACLALTVLVAYGYDAISNTNALSYPSLVIVGVVVSSFFFLYGFLGLYGHFGQAVSAWTKVYVIALWMILAVACSLLVVARWARFTRWAKYLLLLCLIAEGLYYRNGLHPYQAGRDETLPEPIAWVKAEVERRPGSRILNVGRFGVFPNWGSALQIPQLGMLSNFWFPWYEAFFHRYIGSDLFLSLGATPGTTVYLFSDSTLALAGVRYIIVDKWNEPAMARLSGFGYPIVRRDALRAVFENSHAFDRSFAASDVRILDGLASDVGADARYSVTTTDDTLLSEVKRLGIPVYASGPAVNITPGVPNRVEVTEYHHDRIRLRCSLERPAVLVLMDTWSPRWRATVDRKPAYIGKVNVAFRGVAVASGNHEVEFRYFPPSRLLGQVISLISLVTLIVVLWRWKGPRTDGVPVAVRPPKAARRNEKRERGKAC